MKLDRLPPEPGALAGFYADALTALGAVVERSWYDRLDVLAEGAAARVWNDSGQLHEFQVRFPAPDQAGPRDAKVEIFPGCPTTFRLTELLNPSPTTVRRVVLEPDRTSRVAPSDEVAAKTWFQSFPDSPKFHQLTPYTATFHFSAVAIARCEIQAIDQVWSAHQVRFSLLDGRRDATLHDDAVLSIDPTPHEAIVWPTLDNASLQQFLIRILNLELAAELDAIRTRQQRYLNREIRRIDEYFASYEQELRSRRVRAGSNPAGAKKSVEDRIAAARTEHLRRRDDQLQRHAIHVKPHLDALLILAEPAWATTAQIRIGRERHPEPVLYVPHARRWHQTAPAKS